MSLSYDRVAARQNRVPSSLGPKIARPSNTTLTLSTSSSLHLLTSLEQTLCSTLRILPRPYLFLKETLMREWVRLGGRMGASDARRVGGGAAAGTEWGEKVERVWEFLVDTGGLRLPDAEDDEDADDETPESSGGDGEGEDGMEVDEGHAGRNGVLGPVGEPNGDGMVVDEPPPPPPQGQAEAEAEVVAPALASAVPVGLM